MIYWLLVFSLSLCPICKSPYVLRQSVDAKIAQSIFGTAPDSLWYNQWNLVRCEACNNAFYVRPDSITRYEQIVNDLGAKGTIHRVDIYIDTTLVVNPRWAKGGKK